ncbi:MAG: flippase-like domain-containing protein [Rikenellaceae bacterium]|nr:flippase-like domain-containing protein [Rikenellaceae bacterium]
MRIRRKNRAGLPGEEGVNTDTVRVKMSDGNPLGRIKPRNAIYPAIIGLAVIIFLFMRDFDPRVFDDVDFTVGSVFWLLLAVVFMCGRDLGYMARLRTLSGGRLSWAQCFRVIMLWEFTSAVTPSAVGGTSVAILYIHKEGISVGRSSAMVMLTSFLDELYFIVVFPLLIFYFGIDKLFFTNPGEDLLTTGIMAFAVTAYALKLIYLLILSYGLFFNPRGLKWLLMRIFKLGVLRRWYRAVNIVGTDIINSSNEIKGQGGRFWGSVLLSTFLSWTSRYLVANAMVMAFFSLGDHLLMYARQVVMWIVMLILPTPGGSGFAEYLFTNYCSDLIAVPVELQLSAAALIAFLWRGVTYYPYLIIGAVMLPKWITDKFGKGRKKP